MINIEIADEKDIKIIREIVEITWPIAYGEIISVDQINYMIKLFYSDESILEQMNVKNHCFILAKINNEILGFASYELNYQNSSKTRIHKIYVLPKAQGKNIGKSMINYISEMAILKGNNILNLNVNRFNNAVNFYEKLNFTKTKTEDIDIGNGYLMEDFVMEKTLGI